jgi:two-component system NtrC family sensor kinase
MRLAERLRGSVRAKLLALVLAPLMLGFPLIMGVLWYWGEVYYHRLMVSRVASDLATAHGYFERVIDGVGNGVQGLAGSHALAQTLAHESPEAVAALLGARKGGLALDFLNLLDVNGRVLHASTALAAGSARGGWPVVQQAIRARGGSVVERFAPAELAAIDAGMRERARLALVATARARPDSRGEEERGLVVHAAAPVLDAAGNLVAVLEGGVLLNGNLDFVDTLNAIVYREGSLPEGSEGTATLFVDDVRIATNVRLFEGAARARHARLGRGPHACARPRAYLAGDRLRGQRLVRVGLRAGGGQPWRTRRHALRRLPRGALPRRQAHGPAGGRRARAAGQRRRRAADAVLGARHLPADRAHARHHRPHRRRRRAGARVGDVASRDELGRLADHFDHLLDDQARAPRRAAGAQRLARPQGRRAHRASSPTPTLELRAAQQQPGDERRSWPPSASSRPAWRTRSITRSR